MAVPVEMLVTERGQSWPFSWSADNEHIVFAGSRDAVWNVYTVSRRTKAIRQITDFTSVEGYVRYPSWSRTRPAHRVRACGHTAAACGRRSCRRQSRDQGLEIYCSRRGSDMSARTLPSLSSKSASHTSRSASVAILWGADRNPTPRDASRLVRLADVVHVEVHDRTRVIESGFRPREHQPDAGAIEERQPRGSR